MGFKTVYRTLLELFPQVDGRILKAVSIEHSKDLDGAAYFILSEVLPHITEVDASVSVSGIVNHDTSKLVEKNEVVVPRMFDISCASSSMQVSVAADNISDYDEQNDCCHVVGQSVSNELLNCSVGSNSHDGKVSDDELNRRTSRKNLSSNTFVESGAKVCECLDINVINSIDQDDNADGDDLKLGNYTTERSVASQESQDVDDDLSEDINCVLSSSSVVENGDTNNSLTNSLSPILCNNKDGALQSNIHRSFSNDNTPSCAISVDPDIVFVDHNWLHEVDIVNSVSDLEGKYFDGSAGANPEEDTYVFDMVDKDLKSVLSAVTGVPQSEQICRINLLEADIENAKSHKKTLFTSMESVISLMKKVELEEKAVELENEAAAKGGLEILCSVEELKGMLKHAKEANDMHAGEVYGEKAILATEVRELQSRLMGLAEEQDKSLSILEEMRKTLEARFDTAAKVRESAEQGKLEKEVFARDALAEQQYIMENVVQESKVLQKEAEDNQKLREFLMDRGQIVDMLQGEISVICQDVRLLKENFDTQVSLSECLSSKQTRCLLASSCSSEKNMSDQAPEENDELLKITRQELSVDCHPEGRRWAHQVDGLTGITYQGPCLDNQAFKSCFGEETVRNIEKDHLDDDWEMFEDNV